MIRSSSYGVGSLNGFAPQARMRIADGVVLCQKLFGEPGVDFDPKTGAPSPARLSMAPLILEGIKTDIYKPLDAERLSDLGACATVMDFGPGIGEYVPWMVKNIERGNLILADRNRGVVDFLKSFVVRAVALETASPAHPAIATESIDYLRASRVLPFMSHDETDQFFVDACKCLRPGGGLFVTALHCSQTPMDGIQLHALQDLGRIASKHRFRLTRAECGLQRDDEDFFVTKKELRTEITEPWALDELDRQIAFERQRYAGALAIELRLSFRKDLQPVTLRFDE